MAKEKTASPNNAKKDGKGANNLISVVIIIMLAILIVGVGGFAGWYILSGKGTSSQASTSQATTDASSDIAATYDLTDEFTINLADKNQQKYIKVAVSLGYDGSSKLADELKTKQSLVRDAIVNVLMSKTSDEFLNGTDKISKIQDEIKSKINPYFKKGKIIKVLFTGLTIQ